MLLVQAQDADGKPVVLDKEAALKEIDAEVEKFSNFMSTLEDARARGALNNPEKALLRTFLVQKLRGKL